MTEQNGNGAAVGNPARALSEFAQHPASPEDTAISDSVQARRPSFTNRLFDCCCDGVGRLPEDTASSTVCSMVRSGMRSTSLSLTTSRSSVATCWPSWSTRRVQSGASGLRGSHCTRMDTVGASTRCRIGKHPSLPTITRALCLSENPKLWKLYATTSHLYARSSPMRRLPKFSSKRSHCEPVSKLPRSWTTIVRSLWELSQNCPSRVIPRIIHVHQNEHGVRKFKYSTQRRTGEIIVFAKPWWCCSKSGSGKCLQYAATFGAVRRRPCERDWPTARGRWKIQNSDDVVCVTRPG